MAMRPFVVLLSFGLVVCSLWFIFYDNIWRSIRKKPKIEERENYLAENMLCTIIMKWFNVWVSLICVVEFYFGFYRLWATHFFFGSLWMDHFYFASFRTHKCSSQLISIQFFASVLTFTLPHSHLGFVFILFLSRLVLSCSRISIRYDFRSDISTLKNLIDQ